MDVVIIALHPMENQFDSIAYCFVTEADIHLETS